MPQDATCPKCSHEFPVTQARHPVGVDCPGCATELTVEYSKKTSPVEPGDSPYDVVVKKGKPAVSAATPPLPPPKKLRHEDDDEEEKKTTGSGGSMMVVVLASITALLFALGGLGATGYFLFTNLDTEEYTFNQPSKSNNNSAANKSGGNQGSKQGGNLSGTSGLPNVDNLPPIKKNAYELKPLTGALPTIKEPTLPSDSSSLSLGGKAGAVAIGGGGRYIVMHFPDEGQLGIFDVSTAQMIKTPTDSGEVKLAAGLSRVVTLVPSANTMRVFLIVEPKAADQKLTLLKQFDAAVPVNGLGSIVMGSKTNGPLIGVGTFGALHVMDITANNIKEIEEARNDKLELPWGGGMFRATPDGMAYLGCDNLEKGKKVKMAYWDNKQWRKRELNMVPFPGQDGLLYGNGAVTSLRGEDLNYGGVGLGSGEWFVPAACGNSGAFLKVVQTSSGKGFGAKKNITVTIHNKGNASVPAVGTQAISGLPEFEGLWDPFGNASRDKPFDRQLFLFPEAKLLAILSANKDKLLLRRVDLK
jgi:hypothetical protein